MGNLDATKKNSANQVKNKKAKHPNDFILYRQKMSISTIQQSMSRIELERQVIVTT